MVGSNTSVNSHSSFNSEAGSMHVTFPSSIGDPTLGTQSYPYQNTQDDMVCALTVWTRTWADNYISTRTPRRILTIATLPVFLHHLGSLYILRPLPPSIRHSIHPYHPFPSYHLETKQIKSHTMVIKVPAGLALLENAKRRTNQSHQYLLQNADTCNPAGAEIESKILRVMSGTICMGSTKAG